MSDIHFGPVETLQMIPASSNYPRDIMRLRFRDQEDQERVLSFTDEHARAMIQRLRGALDYLTYKEDPEISEVLLRARSRPSRRVDREDIEGWIAAYEDPPMTFEGVLIAEDGESDLHIHLVKYAIEPGHPGPMTTIVVSRLLREELVGFARAVVAELG